MRKSRIWGAALGGAVGYVIGSGTGIVGGVFVGVAGVLVFTSIGILWGLSAGPDLASKYRAWKSR